MAGPSYTGVKTVIDPFEGLQKAVSNAGDIYREYEKSSREADVHNAKMQEVERVKFQRDFLKDYDPQLGVQGKGLSDDAKRFAQAEEERILEHHAQAAARGEEVPDPAELRKQISATYGKLATQESAQQAIMQDFIAQGFSPADAAAYAQSMTGGLVSRTSLQEQETARVAAEREFNKEVREAGDKALEAEARQITANAAVLRAQNTGRDGGQRSTTGSTHPSGSYQEADAFATALENKISSWPLKVDSQAALNVIHKGLESYNQKRLASGLPTLPRSAAYNYAYESIGTKWLIDSDINAQTPGEFEVTLEERFDGDAEAFRRGRYGGGGAGGAGGTVLTELNRNSANMLRNVVLVQPRSMTEIEKARVKDHFKDYIPRPQAASQESGSTTTTTPAGGSTTTTTTQQGAGGTPGKKSGAEVAREVEEARRKKDELLARQEEATRKAEEVRAEREEAAKAVADRSFLADPSLPPADRLTRLRSNIEASDNAQREEAVTNLALERDHILTAIEKNAQRMEERRAKEEEGGRHNNPMIMNVLSDEEARLTTILGRLNRDIAEVENQSAVDTNRPIEELLPRGVPELEEGAGVSPRAAEISRGLLEEYESVAAPSRNGRQRSKLFQDRVDQAAQYIAETDPALAEEVRRAAVFGRGYIDNRLRLVEDARIERLHLNSAREGLERELSDITIPEARYGIQQRIDNIRKQLEFLR